MNFNLQNSQSGLTLGDSTGFGAATDLSLATPGSIKSARNITMSRFNNGPRLELELKLNLSPTRVMGLGPGPDSPARPIGSVSPPSSCVSSEVDEVEPATLMMVVVGCRRCLMYVMMPESVESKCPRCKSHVLLDVSGSGHREEDPKDQID